MSFLVPRSGSSADDTLTQSKYYGLTGGVKTLYLTQNTLTGVNSRSFSGYSIPDFHRRVKRGELLPHTPWTQYECIGSTTGGSQCTAPWTGGVFWSEPEWPPLGTWSLESNDLLSRVQGGSKHVQNAAAKIYSSGHDTLTFLSELRQVKQMFSSCATRLLSLDLPNSWKRKKPPYNWRNIPSDWLQYRYGWRTLVMDLQSLQKAIQNYNNARTRFSERSGEHYTEPDFSVTPWTGVFCGAAYTGTLTVEQSFKVSVRGSVVADISVPQFQFNPLITAWELIPYSFMVDWIFTVGKALSAISFLALQTNYSASWGCQVTGSKKLTLRGTADAPYVGTIWQDSTCFAKYELRVPCGVPYHPYLNPRVDLSKIADTLSVLSQKIRR